MLYRKHNPLRFLLAGAGAAALAVSAMITSPGVAAGEKPDVKTPYVKAGDPWFQAGRAALEARLAIRPNTNRAKNVILMIADGFGVTAATAARIYDGQKKGGEGEDNFLNHERLPYNALIKTYSADGQVPDSAATASAIMTGVKTNNGAVSVSDSTVDCATMQAGVPATIAERAMASGRSAGAITTTFIVDATPATTYAHSPSRYWAIPSRIPEADRAAGCRDIAVQLVESGLSVAMGGGRAVFVPEDTADVETLAEPGSRDDGRNLTEEWRASRAGTAYVTSREELQALDLGATGSLLGLFAHGSMVFEVEDGSDGRSNPTLAEMTSAAIDVLSRDEDGYFLLVEHEGTDDLQHEGLGRRFLDAAREFNEAVAVALEKVDLEETLVIVTADHAQAVVFQGYPMKGNPVLGLASQRDEQGNVTPLLADDGKPYTALGFYAGPGAVSGERPDLTGVDTAAPDFRQQALIPTGGVPHSADDVPAYANGPWAHLVGGLLEQNTLFHIMAHAMGLDEE